MSIYREIDITLTPGESKTYFFNFRSFEIKELYGVIEMSVGNDSEIMTVTRDVVIDTFAVQKRITVKASAVSTISPFAVSVAFTLRLTDGIFSGVEDKFSVSQAEIDREAQNLLTDDYALNIEIEETGNDLNRSKGTLKEIFAREIEFFDFNPVPSFTETERNRFNTAHIIIKPHPIHGFFTIDKEDYPGTGGVFIVIDQTIRTLENGVTPHVQHIVHYVDQISNNLPNLTCKGWTFKTFKANLNYSTGQYSACEDVKISTIIGENIKVKFHCTFVLAIGRTELLEN